GCIAAAFDRVALLVESGLPGEVRRAMQVVDVLGNHGALGVLPGAAADAVLGIDGRGAASRLCAQISAPGLAAGAGRLCKLLAMRIGTGKSAEIAALAEADAGDEEGRGRLLRLQAGGGAY